MKAGESEFLARLTAARRAVWRIDTESTIRFESTSYRNALTKVEKRGISRRERVPVELIEIGCLDELQLVGLLINRIRAEIAGLLRVAAYLKKSTVKVRRSKQIRIDLKVLRDECAWLLRERKAIVQRGYAKNTAFAELRERLASGEITGAFTPLEPIPRPKRKVPTRAERARKAAAEKAKRAEERRARREAEKAAREKAKHERMAEKKARREKARLERLAAKKAARAERERKRYQTDAERRKAQSEAGRRYRERKALAAGKPMPRRNRKYATDAERYQAILASNRESARRRKEREAKGDLMPIRGTVMGFSLPRKPPRGPMIIETKYASWWGRDCA